jgi:DUF1680 family protein
MQKGRTSFVVDTSQSPYAKLRPVPVKNVHLNDSFWAPRQKILRETTLPSQYHLLEETGRLANLRRAAGKQKSDFIGLVFNDSDVYKWVEAVAFSLAETFDQELYVIVKQVVAEIVAAQDKDGYLNTYFSLERKKERWTNLRDLHELYCAGHLIQAAIALYRATGEPLLFKAACRFADCIVDTFGSNKRSGTPGHPEIEIALVELFRETRKKDYLEMAKFFIDQRGRGLIGGGEYHIDHKPFRELEEIGGHAVRSVYLNCGATDIFLESGDETLLTALIKLWNSMTERRMYATGGIGARHAGESFGEDYELPNMTAYAETCAAIANVMWNWRMLLATGEAKFADVLELALYNSVLSGISLDGREYFYVNPLADRGKHRRQEWFTCACCPPNIARVLASLSGYVYCTSDEGVWVNLYAQNKTHLNVKGNSMTIAQRTNYPWDGNVEITIQPEKPIAFSLFIRIPGWCKEPEVKISSQPVRKPVKSGTYFGIHRKWKFGDLVQVFLHMPVERIVCHPLVTENMGRVALTRGPLVYCVEQADNPGFDVWNLVLSHDSTFKTEWKPKLLNGVVVICGESSVDEMEGFENKLYRPVSETSTKLRNVRFTAIPYYAWANREAGPMTVWIRTL